MSFLTELKRRNVFRVSATYVVASWLIIQVVSAVATPLNLPDWFETVVVVLLVIGFPIAVLFAWAFELTPDGIRVTQSAGGEKSGPTLVAVDYALVAALAVVAGVTIWSERDTTTAASPMTGIATLDDKSIAVLPFVDMSLAGDQAYFGDGIAEELLNELTRLEGLRVAGRTSSFSFRNKNEDLRAIGEALDVKLIVEGSVRKDGDRLRITAQLIDARDGSHHWSQTYDRNLTDIFAIQDEIAASIAGVLGVRLGVGSVNSFRGAGTDSVAAYEAYLKAFQLPNRRLSERVRLLEQAVELDEDYAAALAGLGLSTAVSAWLNPPEQAPAIVERAEPLLMRAVAVSPESAYAHALLGNIHFAKFDWIKSEEYTTRSLNMLRDGETLQGYANLLMRAGRSAEAVGYYEAGKGASLHPTDSTWVELSAYRAVRDYERLGKVGESVSPNQTFPRQLIVAIDQKDIAGIATSMDLVPKDSSPRGEFLTFLHANIESAEKVLAYLEELAADSGRVWPSKYYDIAVWAALHGDPELALATYSIEARLTPLRAFILWYPVMSDVRKLPAFKDLVAEINLLDYWRTYGWPDHCRPTGGNDFECF